MDFATQAVWLVLLALPVAALSWTLTHEEITREPREYCERRSRAAHRTAERKFFFLFTCEYCLSHYVAAIFVAITRFHLLLADWRGYLISVFALVWIANVYMSIYARLRLNIRRERGEIEEIENSVGDKKQRARRPAA